MSSPSNQFAHLKVPLQDILSATNYLDEEIRYSTFAKEYKGQLLWSGELIDISARRFNKERYDREQLFWMDISVLSSLKHKNLLSLVGFCDENDEKIIITRYETKGMLNGYLSDPMLLTWVRRLKICLGVAHALSYIHYDESRDFSVIHRRLCSANVVLNDDWEPKLSDFEYSMKIKASQRHHSFHNNTLEGLNGYVDSTYLETKRVSHKLDMYSFGIVMLELMCGRESITKHPDNKYLATLAKFHYKKNTLDEIIDLVLWKQMDRQSFNIFAKTAFDCLNEERPQRPNIEEILTRLESGLKLQMERQNIEQSVVAAEVGSTSSNHEKEDYEKWEPELPKDYNKLIKMSKCPEMYSTKKKEELYNILSTGILLQQDKVLLSFVGNGDRKEMVSAAMFSYNNSCPHEWKSLPESRFGTVVKILDISDLNFEVKTRAQFLSLDIIYGVYLVFKFCESRNFASKPIYVDLSYTKGHESLKAYFATWRHSEWMIIELYRFLNKNEDFICEFLLECFSSFHCGDGSIYVEGVEFRAIEKVKHETEKLEEGNQLLETNFTDQVLQLLTNFEEIFKISRNYDELFWLGEVNGMKLLMLSAKASLYKFSNVNLFASTPSAQSRFQEVIELLPQRVFHINCTIKSKMLSHDTEYVCYLLFKLSENCQGMHCPVKVRDVLHQENSEAEFFYFSTPSPVNIHDFTRVPKQRKDG